MRTWSALPSRKALIAKYGSPPHTGRTPESPAPMHTAERTGQGGWSAVAIEDAVETIDALVAALSTLDPHSVRLLAPSRSSGHRAPSTSPRPVGLFHLGSAAHQRRSRRWRKPLPLLAFGGWCC
ncbi:hypothetical protein [Streptomyces roseifaciens]|uniref:hypothetical protein n=1 Tax=Streptomyces roseifaciens TaxID=1488406 RepID=UPI0011875C6B|nr:hypothetical protein [Streptomyces roseifaciens]